LRRPLAGMLVLTAAVAALKPCALAMSALRFGRTVLLIDIVAVYGRDAIVLLATLAVVSLPALIVKGASVAGVRVPATSLQGLSNLLAGLCLALTAYYLIAGYAFWEWGAFINRHEIKAAIRARAVAGVVAYALSVKLALVLALTALAVAMVALLSRWLARAGRPPKVARTLAAALAVAAFGLAPQLSGGGGGDPALSSPVIQAVAPQPFHSDGLPGDWPRPSLADFRLPAPGGTIKAEEASLFGAADGLDVIIVVLESVRRASLGLYGRARDPMPNLTRLSEHGIVFTNAYVNQPRSCKTMASLMLGIYPDPRLRALTWQDERMEGHESLLSRLRERGYSSYFGIMADHDADNYTAFLQAVSGGLDRAVGFEELGPSARPTVTTGDDLILIEDYLGWYQRQAGPSVAVLWLMGAHFPYDAHRKSFAENDIVDRYDNCLYASDVAIGALFAELERMGRSERVLALVLADHGEALAEKTGDTIHGKLFYDYSVRVPCVLLGRGVFSKAQQCSARFQVKDLTATLLSLLGDPSGMRQSQNIFGKHPDDPIYMSNVFQDFKLAKLAGSEKFVFRPGIRASYLYDTSEDAEEATNRIDRLDREEIQRRQRELLQWYYYQIEYLEREFPPVP